MARLESGGDAVFEVAFELREDRVAVEAFFGEGSGADAEVAAQVGLD